MLPTDESVGGAGQFAPALTRQECPAFHEMCAGVSFFSLAAAAVAIDRRDRSPGSDALDQQALKKKSHIPYMLECRAVSHEELGSGSARCLPARQ